MEKRKIEVFTAGCPVCEPVVEMVQAMACNSCEVTIYNLSLTGDTNKYLEKVKAYNITSLPAVAVNGLLLSCCKGKEVSRQELELAGIGKEIK